MLAMLDIDGSISGVIAYKGLISRSQRAVIGLGD